MLKVQSFLKEGNNFIPIAKFSGMILDSNYIEGAIEISYQGKKLMNSTEHWDYVDQLWSYFVNGLADVVKGLEFETYLPDQPVKVVFKPDSKRQWVIIKVGEDETPYASVRYEEFMCVMLTEANAFFQRMNKLLPNSQDLYAQALKDLSVLEKKGFNSTY